VDVVRTTARQTALDLHNFFPDETRDWVEKAVIEYEAKGNETTSRPIGGQIPRGFKLLL
jgi:hypothetical protein